MKQHVTSGLISVRNCHHQRRSIAVICSWRVRFALLLCAFVICFFSEALASNGEEEGHKGEYKWFFTLYGGLSAQDNLGDVLSFQATFPDHTYIAVAALSRELWRYEHWVSLEAEGQVGKHFGRMHHWEFNGLISLRWLPFPWDKYLETSFAVGNGLSYATEVPKVEKEDDDNAQKFLNYLLLELTLGLPKYPRWDFVIRIHHRSGVFGLYDGVRGGANFLCGGIKYRF